MKALTFKRLFQLCDANNQLKIIVENLKKIEELSKDWKLSLEERRDLLKSCAAALDRNNETHSAFKLLKSFLRLFQDSKEAELAQHNIEVQAKRCVLLAIREPTALDFADILQLNAVKYLQGVSSEE